MSAKKFIYQQEIQQMMFVFGEVSDPLEETCQLVEEIVRTQLIELISQAVQHSAKKGKFLSAEDLIFIVRHDKSKVNRLTTFLSWKDVRKRVKDDPKEGDDDLLEDKQKIKKANIKYSWDLFYSYSNILSDDEDEDADEEELMAYEDQTNRLRIADEITRTMSKDEYIYFSECRQASFTYKKAKRFREWCEMTKFMDSKANSDVLDILGFLACEIVRKITETALEIKKEWDTKIRLDQTCSNVREVDFLFDRPDDAQTPLQSRHIYEAFCQMQKSNIPLQVFRKGWTRSLVNII